MKIGVEWRLGPVTHEVNKLLAENHYLGPIRSGGYVCSVVGELNSETVAAQVWRRPTSRRLPNSGAWLELSRWCLTSPAGDNAGSRQHGAAVRLLREKYPEVSTLVSYSDPGQGHTGALYRACNWLWAPTWHRLRPPPTGQGNWGGGARQGVKDRWVFPLRRDDSRSALLAVKDAGAIRRWLSQDPPEKDLRLALASPATDLVDAVQRHRG